MRIAIAGIMILLFLGMIALDVTSNRLEDMKESMQDQQEQINFLMEVSHRVMEANDYVELRESNSDSIEARRERIKPQG